MATMRSPGERRAGVAARAELAALVLLAYVPFLATLPGRVTADSKQYLYLHPGRFLERATHLWDPQVAAGTVPHQHLGYLVPMGPWFWVFDRLGVPDWIAQRLWLGTISLVAVLGARWLFSQVGTGRLGALAGAIVYVLTPYQLAFSGRVSVLLLPWAALPWLVGLTMRATRTGDWRAPAAVGLVVFATGGVNASSLLLVALAPITWVVVELSSRRRIDAARAALRIAVVCAGVCAWWIVGLVVQGAYGLPILQLTENVDTVAATSSPGEVVRGLGNWFLYVTDTVISRAYATDDLTLLLTFALAVAGVVAALVVRWTYRAYFVSLVVVGTVVAVGAWPLADPPPYAAAWRDLTTSASAGLAFRNSPRAIPLVVLGFAGLVAACVGAMPRPAWRRVGTGAVTVLAAGALLPVWQHGMPGEDIDRDEELPAHWVDAIAAVDAGDRSTRVLEIPGATFAYHDWGATVDPITPGLTDRPYLAQEVLPSGTPATVNLLRALDRRFQLGVFEPAALTPLARLFGVGTVVLRGDLDRDEVDTPDPGPIWRALTAPVPEGLDDPATFGPRDASDGDVPAVAVFDLKEPRSIVRLAPGSAPIVLAGDGDGVVDAAAAGLLEGDEVLLYSSALSDPALADAVASGGHLVVTDSNRRRIQTWFAGLRDTRGPTEQAGVTAPDPSGYDVRLDPFPTDDDDRSVVVQVGGSAHATREGGPWRPEDRAARAVDGDPGTAWQVAGPVEGASLTIRPASPLAASTVQLRLPDPVPGRRSVNRVRVTVNEEEPFEVVLDGTAHVGAGQQVPLRVDEVRQVQIDLVEATDGDDPGAPVGLAEVSIAGLRILEAVRPPVDLLGRAGDAASTQPLDVVLTRLRLDLPGTDRQDEERRLVRLLDLPATRTFTVRGTVRTADHGAVLPDSGCRRDVLAIDGLPVPVELRPDPVDPGVGELLGCEPVQLGGGAAALVEALPAAGIDVDRLVLSSAGQVEPAAPVPTGALRVVDESASSLRVEVDGATAPFWFVLGQGSSDGWAASAEGAALGERQLVDGFANGWLVIPDDDGVVTIDLQWGPQRLLPIGVAVSSIALVAAAALLLRGRRGGAWPALAAAPSLRRVTPATALRPAEAAVVAAVVAAGSAVVAPVDVAVVAGALTLLVAAVRPLGHLTVLVAPLALIASELADRPSLAWLAVLALAADAVVEARRVRETG